MGHMERGLLVKHVAKNTLEPVETGSVLWCGSIFYSGCGTSLPTETGKRLNSGLCDLVYVGELNRIFRVLGENFAFILVKQEIREKRYDISKRQLEIKPESFHVLWYVIITVDYMSRFYRKCREN